MGQPYLSVWSFILKKLMQAYSHVGCFPREQKQKLQDILRLRLRAYPESLLLHSVTQSHKASPYWMCGGVMIPDSWLEEPQGICGCWQYTTLLDREVNVSGLLPVIAKGRCLLECLANLYQLSIPITMTLWQKALLPVQSHEKFSTNRNTFVTLNFWNQPHYSWTFKHGFTF